MNVFDGFGSLMEASDISEVTKDTKPEISQESQSKFDKLMGDEQPSEVESELDKNDKSDSPLSVPMDKFEKIFSSEDAANEKSAETNGEGTATNGEGTATNGEGKELASQEKDNAEDKSTNELASEAGDHSDKNVENGEQQADNAENAPEHMPCRNENLEGQKHPETGVPFEKKEVEVDGKKVEVVVPVFDSAFDAQLPEDMYTETDSEQFKECNAQLKNAVENDKELRDKFDDEQLEQIMNGETPDGYTWHHDAETGKMQLVDTETHQKTGHTGGRSIWGGGSENR